MVECMTSDDGSRPKFEIKANVRILMAVACCSICECNQKDEKSNDNYFCNPAARKYLLLICLAAPFALPLDFIDVANKLRYAAGFR